MLKRLTAMFISFALILSAVSSCGSEGYRILKILTVIGSGHVTRKAEDISPYEGMHLSRGDIVSTDTDSNIRISLDDDKFILLEPDSGIELTASGTSEKSLTSITLIKGAFLNEITAPLSEGSEYTVKTPKAAMAVRGTSFRVVYEPQESGDVLTTVQTFHGSVSMQITDSSENAADSLTLTENTQAAILTSAEVSDDPSVPDTVFVVPDENSENGFTAVDDPAEAVTAIDYSTLPEETLTEIINTNDNGDIKLADNIVSDIEDQLAASPASAVTEVSEVTEVSQTEPPVTTAPIITSEVSTEAAKDLSRTPSEVFTKKLTYLTWYENDDPQGLKETAREFGVPEYGNESYGKYKNKFLAPTITTYEGLYATLYSLIASGSSPDAIINDNRSLPVLVYSGLISPIDDIIDLSDKSWDRTRALTEMCAFGGKHYLPSVEPSLDYAWWYNINTIRKEGLEDPYELYIEGRWDWNTFIEMADKFKSSGDGKYPLDTWNDESIICSTGIPLVGMDNGRLINNISDPRIEKAIGMMRTILDKKYNLYFELEESGYQPDIQRWIDGKTLFMTESDNLYWNLIANVSSDPDSIRKDAYYVPAPYMPGLSKGYSTISTGGFLLLSGSDNSELYAAVINVINNDWNKMVDDGIMGYWASEELNKRAYHLILENGVQPVFSATSGLSGGFTSGGEQHGAVEGMLYNITHVQPDTEEMLTYEELAEIYTDMIDEQIAETIEG